MASFRPQLQACPSCGSKGNCRTHAYYGRTIIDFIGGRKVTHELCILRLFCSCGHTHAVLPDFIIPYLSYGLFFLLRVLAEYFCSTSSVECLCERFCITQNQLYRWLSLFGEHKALWLGILDSLDSTDPSFFRHLVSLEEYSAFAGAFAARFSFSFLQAHKNPASSRRLPFLPGA